MALADKYDVAIIGAGPVGLFAVFQLGLLGLKAVLIDTLDKVGGQCAELYPEKPIYDIPAYPIISGQELTDKLMAQIAPFEPTFILDEHVSQIIERQDKRFVVTTNQGTQVEVAAVFIAAGAGSFTPRKPKLEGLEAFENKSFFYAVRNRALFKNEDVLIVGGGDSALDWALNFLDHAKSVTLMHRSNRFKAAPHSVHAMEEAVKAGRLTFIEGELGALKGKNGVIESVILKSGQEIKPSKILAFFGLNIELGPIAAWNLALAENKLINVDTENFETSTKGIFAVGDINYYPGKLKLILSGFHEVALAAQEAFRIARPQEKLRFQYTTSSTELQKRLKVA